MSSIHDYEILEPGEYAGAERATGDVVSLDSEEEATKLALQNGKIKVVEIK